MNWNLEKNEDEKAENGKRKMNTMMEKNSKNIKIMTMKKNNKRKGKWRKRKKNNLIILYAISTRIFRPLSSQNLIVLDYLCLKG
jgi:hypothetical protein